MNPCSLPRRLLPAIVVCLLLSGQAVSAQQPAGITLYMRNGDAVWLLLADHGGHERGWAAYGGGAHPGETVAETAARETEEETRGYFSRADLLERIADQDPVIDANGFALFFAEVPFVPAQVVASHPVPEDSAYHERVAFAWVPASQVEGYLDHDIDSDRRYALSTAFLPPGNTTPWLWPVGLANLRQATRTTGLPWRRER